MAFGAGDRHVVDIVHRLLNRSIGVEVLTELHANLLEIFRSSELSGKCFVPLKHMCSRKCARSTLLRFLLDSANLLCDIEESSLFGKRVLTDIIRQSVTELADPYGRVYRYVPTLLRLYGQDTTECHE
jgi:hypothetical protein